MTATGHAIIGAVIAAKIGNPALAIPIAFASHIAADAFPHWDTGTNAKLKTKLQFFLDSVIDLLFSFIISYALLYFLFPTTNWLYALVIILASQGLDWLTAPYTFLRIKEPFFKSIYHFQKLFDHKQDKPWGIINQIAILIIIVILAKII